MRITDKAVLLSALVFPGAGHIYLKRYWRGLTLIILSLSALGIVIWMAMISVLSRLEGTLSKIQGGALSSSAIANLVDVKTLDMPSYYNAILFFLFGCWLFAIIDAYRIGKEKDRKVDAEMAKL